jgi:hypothetical protein
LKRILELQNYKLVGDDEWNWAMAKEGEVPLIIPKDGEYVAVEILMDTLVKAGLTLGKFLPLRAQSAKDLGIQPN